PLHQPPGPRLDALQVGEFGEHAPPKREEPAPAPSRPVAPPEPRTSSSFGGLGSVPARDEEPVTAEPSSSLGEVPAPSSTPQVPPARPSYSDSAAEELDVPDFLK
ncbi:cell division protein FtsZ, partial [Streptomyces lydicus]